MDGVTEIQPDLRRNLKTSVAVLKTWEPEANSLHFYLS